MIRLMAIIGLVLGAAVAQAQPPSAQRNVTKIVGGAFDPVSQEQAPEDGMLIGFEITLGRFVDRDVIQSLRPIFRTAKGDERLGKQYGEPQGTVYLAKAKPGYAVGGIKLRTGLLIDGMSIIFMKVRGDTLDPKDALATSWIGNEIGGSPSTLAGDGTPVVGFAAKVTDQNKQCSGMGLILKHAPKESQEPTVFSAGVTRANFDRIKMGMSENQVRALLGPPHSSSQRVATVLSWRQMERHADGTNVTTVTVTLRSGRVAEKNWRTINYPNRSQTP